MLIHPGLGVVCAAFTLSYPQLQTSLPLRSFPLTSRLLSACFGRIILASFLRWLPSFIPRLCHILARYPPPLSREVVAPLSQLRLAQDHYTCASPYDTGMGRGDEVEGGVVLLIFYTFACL